MNPSRCAQDVLRCHLCEEPVPTYHCDFCKINVCKACAGKHLLNESDNHKLVPIQQQWTPNYPKCTIHSEKQCELYCEQCDLNICAQCISSGEHDQHRKIDIFKRCDNIKEGLRKALKELENFIFPQHKAAASSITFYKADLMKNSRTLIRSIQQQGEVWHKEIDSFIQNLQSEVIDMESEHLGVLQTQKNKIDHKISEIAQTILDLKNLVDSHDICLVSECKFNIDDFKTLPQQMNVRLPTFTAKNTNLKELLEQVGLLSTLSVTIEERTYPTEYPVPDSSPLDKPFLEEPKIIESIHTQYHGLYNVAFRRQDEIWTCGLDKFIRLYNLKGELLESIQTKTWSEPYDIAVLKSGELVYTDPKDSSVNIVKNSQIEPLIRLAGWIWTWKPLGVCTTLSGELLVSMVSVDYRQAKVVRYFGYEEKQSIQWDDQRKPLFSFGFSSKCLCENRNLNICVADYGAKAVVVVASSGKLRFSYTGNSHTTNGSFAPTGIATDSHCRILTADYMNQRIHILNQDGHFLRYINSHNLGRPWGICIDINDNLFVAGWNTNKVKKIQYYE